ncbi:MAG: hypothetical protein KDA37_10050, partial [Planctomycetales bacterium]|nr:hypothetical protein [Planctomycetales bacterium]
GWIADLDVDASTRATRRAQEELWERYFARLVRLASIKLGRAPRGAADEEDVALSALQSFFDGATEGRFPLLSDRHSLWPLLAKITAHKAIDQQRRALAQKKGGGAVRGNSALLGADGATPDFPDALLDEQLRPDYLVEVSEQCEHLMGLLPDDQMRCIARMKLAGHTNAEIAGQLQVAVRTVERRIGVIRQYWAEFQA